MILLFKGHLSGQLASLHSTLANRINHQAGTPKPLGSQCVLTTARLRHQAESSTSYKDPCRAGPGGARTSKKVPLGFLSFKSTNSVIAALESSRTLGPGAESYLLGGAEL